MLPLNISLVTNTIFDSLVQSLAQPSSSWLLPSSHCSTPSWTKPSPQVASTQATQASL